VGIFSDNFDKVMNPLQDCAVRVIHISTPTRVHSYTVGGLRIHPGRPQVPAQGSRWLGWYESSKLSYVPGDRC